MARSAEGGIRKWFSLGRPAAEVDPVVTVRLSREAIYALDLWCEQQGLESRSEALRALVRIAFQTIGDERYWLPKPAVTKSSATVEKASDYCSKRRSARGARRPFAGSLRRMVSAL